MQEVPRTKSLPSIDIAPEPTLPPELCQLIINELADDSPSSIPSLLACSLVCVMFCKTARRQLFSTINIFLVRENTKIQADSTIYVEYLKRISEILQMSLAFPEIGMVYYIQSFRLDADELEEPQLSMLLNDKHFPGLLKSLHGPKHGISRFTLEILPEESISFPELSSEFCEAFIDLCWSNSLTSLRLRGFSDLPRTLLLGTRADNIQFNKCSILPPWQDTAGTMERLYITDLNTEVPLMRSIAVDDSFPLIDLLNGNMLLEARDRYINAFSRLTSLDLCARVAENLPDLVEIAQHASQTLEVLAISVYGGVNLQASGPVNLWADSPPFELGTLKNLHTLKISSRQSFGLGTFALLPPINVLDKITSVPPNLRRVSLRARSDTRIGDPMNFNWQPLETLVTQPRFNRIPERNLSLAYCTWVNPSSDDRSEFHEKLKAIAKAGLPSFTSIQSIECTCAFD